MDYRTGVLAIHALVEDEAAFCAVVEQSRDFDPEAFADFARAGNVQEWLTPLAAVERARALLSADFVEELATLHATQPGLKQALLALCGEVRAALGAAGISSLFLKGLCLGQWLYGDLHRRHQHDVDVLVRPAHFEGAVAVLTTLGFETGTAQVSRRLRKLRTRDPRRAPQTITAQRADGLEIDLHCRTKSRWFHGVDENAFWTDRQIVCIGECELETLSDEHALLLLLVSICADLERGACRVKHFLDLYLMLRALEEAQDWERFFAEREGDGLLKVSASVFAIFLTLWDCAVEFPTLAHTLEARRRSIELGDADEALALVTRPRHSQANHAWYRRLGSRSPLVYWSWRLSADLPHSLRRALAPPWVQPGDVPWKREDDPLACLPPAICALLEREGLRARRALDITPLPGPGTARRSYRIELSDGRIVKGRSVRNARLAAQLQRWLPLLPKERFPTLLAASDAASLESWYPGQPCTDPDDALRESSGVMLSELHRLIELEDVTCGDPRLSGWFDEAERWTRALHDGGHLDGEAARRVLTRIGDSRPDQATWGLKHDDFCLENFVFSEQGLCCVDNVTVAPGILESDLAQTFYRWPMSGVERESFLRGYGASDVATRFLDHERFWMLAVTLRAAEWRMRRNTGGIDVPLALLERYAR